LGVAPDILKDCKRLHRLLGLLDAEDGGNTVYQNVRSHSPNNTVSHPRRLRPSAIPCENPKPCTYCPVPLLHDSWCHV